MDNSKWMQERLAATEHVKPPRWGREELVDTIFFALLAAALLWVACPWAHWAVSH